MTETLSQQASFMPPLKERNILLVVPEDAWGIELFQAFEGLSNHVTWVKNWEALDRAVDSIDKQRMPAIAVVMHDRSHWDELDIMTSLRKPFPEIQVILIHETEGPEAPDDDRISRWFEAGAFCCLPKGPVDRIGTVITRHASKALAHHLLFGAQEKLMHRLKQQEGSFRNIIQKETQRLYDAYQELKAMDKLKMDLITLISHQIRTPLCSILGQTELLLDGLYDDEQDLKQMLDVVHSQGRRLARFVQDINTFLCYRLGKVSVHFSRFSLMGVVDQAMEMLIAQAKEKSMNIHVDIPDHLIIQSDMRVMTEVIKRILENAIVYSESGSNIWLTCEYGEGRLSLHIQDEGKGVDPKRLGNLCKLLQASHDMRYHMDGNGMGLAICAEMMKFLGGKLRFFSEGRDKGCLVKIRLPFIEKMSVEMT